MYAKTPPQKGNLRRRFLFSEGRFPKILGGGKQAILPEELPEKTQVGFAGVFHGKKGLNVFGIVGNDVVHPKFIQGADPVFLVDGPAVEELSPVMEPRTMEAVMKSERTLKRSTSSIS